MKASRLIASLLADEMFNERRNKGSDIDTALKLVRYMNAAGKKKDEKKDEKKPKITPMQLSLFMIAFGPIIVTGYLVIIAKGLATAFTTLGLVPAH